MGLAGPGKTGQLSLALSQTFEAVTRHVTQEALGHPAASRISRAEDQQALHISG